MKQTVIMYHDVNDDPNARSKYTVLADQFELHIAAIAETLKKKNIPNDKIVLTFDDGYESFVKTIAPILEKYNFKGIFFISTNYIGKKDFMTEKQLIELRDRGHTIGTHSHTHPAMMTSLPKKEIEDEWETSINELERILSQKIEYASIPGGYFCDISKNTLSRLGIKYICTSKPTRKIKITNDNIQIIGRFSIEHGNTAKQITSLFSPFSRFGLFQMMRSSIVRFIKAIFGASYYKARNIIMGKWFINNKFEASQHTEA